jgi:hypothetical protein
VTASVVLSTGTFSQGLAAEAEVEVRAARMMALNMVSSRVEQRFVERTSKVRRPLRPDPTPI